MRFFLGMINIIHCYVPILSITNGVMKVNFQTSNLLFKNIFYYLTDN